MTQKVWTYKGWWWFSSHFWSLKRRNNIFVSFLRAVQTRVWDPCINRMSEQSLEDWWMARIEKSMRERRSRWWIMYDNEEEGQPSTYFNASLNKQLLYCELERWINNNELLNVKYTTSFLIQIINKNNSHIWKMFCSLNLICFKILQYKNSIYSWSRLMWSLWDSPKVITLTEW